MSSFKITAFEAVHVGYEKTLTYIRKEYSREQ